MSKTTENTTMTLEQAIASEQAYAGTRASSADPEKVSEIQDTLKEHTRVFEGMSKAGKVRTFFRMGYAVREIAEATSIPYGETWNAARKYQQRSNG